MTVKRNCVKLQLNSKLTSGTKSIVRFQSKSKYSYGKMKSTSTKPTYWLGDNLPRSLKTQHLTSCRFILTYSRTQTIHATWSGSSISTLDMTPWYSVNWVISTTADLPSSTKSKRCLLPKQVSLKTPERTKLFSSTSSLATSTSTSISCGLYPGMWLAG